MAEIRFGTFDELMEGVAGEVQAIADSLRKTVYEIHPACVEVVRLGDSAACMGVGPKKMSEAYCYIMPQKDRVNLGFFVGAALPDPVGLLEGTGKTLRHVKVRSLDEAKSAVLHDLIRAALAERQGTLGKH